MQDDIPLSALEHYSYCPRQCGLIHIDRVWEESAMTLQGSELHRRVDEYAVRHERGREVRRGVTLWSCRLRLYGRADVVEVLDDGTLVPVEYKRGGRRPNHHELIQLCAQALCLEEMLDARVAEGALYHAASRRLIPVAITEELRRDTERIAQGVHDLLDGGVVPDAVYDVRCDVCSLAEACLAMVASPGSPEEALHVLYDTDRTNGWVEAE